MPAIVGTVAWETPAAIARTFPEPETAMTSNTLIMPVTVPMSPNNGQSATSVWIMGILLLVAIENCEISRSRIMCAFQERRSLRVLPRDMRWSTEGADALRVAFSLWPGSYATSVMRELVGG